MDFLRRRVVHVPAREELFRLAFAEKAGADDEQETERVLPLFVLGESSKEGVFGNDGAE